MGLKRSSVDDWWVEQKFTDDRREPRAGLYRDVQWTFATAYYAQAGLAGERVLDFGCGPGLFARLFARHGATVLGLDINPDHLETARRLVQEDGLADQCAIPGTGPSGGGRACRTARRSALTASSSATS